MLKTTHSLQICFSAIITYGSYDHRYHAFVRESLIVHVQVIVNLDWNVKLYVFIYEN